MITLVRPPPEPHELLEADVSSSGHGLVVRVTGSIPNPVRPTVRPLAPPTDRRTAWTVSLTDSTGKPEYIHAVDASNVGTIVQAMINAGVAVGTNVIAVPPNTRLQSNLRLFFLDNEYADYVVMAEGMDDAWRKLEKQHGILPYDEEYVGIDLTVAHNEMIELGPGSHPVSNPHDMVFVF